MSTATAVEIPSPTEADLARFNTRITTGPDGCLLWTGGLNGAGYGSFWMQGRKYLAHRVAYRHWVGELNSYDVLDHLCRTPACTAPDHLEQVTRRTNAKRGRFGELTTSCPAGHEYTSENTFLHRNRHGNESRDCITCRRNYDRNRRRR